MSREIKFRVWSESDKEYRDDLLSELTPPFITADYNDEGDRFDIEQYTGLKDKNGKEIYEGDIVKSSGYLFKVVWRELDTSFILENDEDEMMSSLFMNDCDKYRVIGNIHENPELLEGDKDE